MLLTNEPHNNKSLGNKGKRRLIWKKNSQRTQILIGHYKNMSMQCIETFFSCKN